MNVKTKTTNTESGKRKPFGGKGGRKRRPTKADIEKAEAQARIDEIEAETANAYGEPSSIASAFNGFFYTDEKFITKFEDGEIVEYIQRAHPEYEPYSGDEYYMRRAVLSLLGDSKFMTALLERYNMTIFDFFKFLFRIEPSIFKGSFITKVQNAIKRKKYAYVKRHCYRFNKKQAKRKRSQKSSGR